jgi:hypothetical protein
LKVEGKKTGNKCRRKERSERENGNQDRRKMKEEKAT